MKLTLWREHFVIYPSVEIFTHLDTHSNLDLAYWIELMFSF